MDVLSSQKSTIRSKKIIYIMFDNISVYIENDSDDKIRQFELYKHLHGEFAPNNHFFGSFNP